MKEGLPEEVTFKQRPDLNEMMMMNISGKGNSWMKMGVYTISETKSNHVG